MAINKKIVELDLNDVLPNRFQPRLKFNENRLEELSNSIKQHGVIQPIIVRRLGDKFEIVAGERRYKASVMADAKSIPAIVTELNDKESSEIALIENVQRSDLTPIEEAISFKKVLDMNYFTQEELASRLGKTQSTIANKLRLLNLDEEVQEALLDMKISERHARSLLKIKKSELQRKMLERIVDERLTVRRTDEEIDNMLRDNEIEFLSFGDQGQKTEDSIEMPSIDIVVPESPTLDIITPENDMLYNQPTMDIQGLVGLDSGVTDYSSPIPSSPIEEVSISMPDQSLNPGFMNIDDIESNAKDIFIERPIRPFEVDAVAPVEETAPIQEERSSFININPIILNDEETEQGAGDVLSAPTSTSGDMFDFNFEEVNDMKKPDVKIPELSGLGNLSGASATASQGVIEELIPSASESLEVVGIETSEPIVEPINEVENVVLFDEPVIETTNYEELPVIEESIVTEIEMPVEEAIATEEETEVLSLTGEIPIITPEVTANAANEEFVLSELPAEEPIYDITTDQAIQLPGDLPPVEPIPVTEMVEPVTMEDVPVENPVLLEDDSKKEEKKGFFSKLFDKKEEIIPVEPVTPVELSEEPAEMVAQSIQEGMIEKLPVMDAIAEVTFDNSSEEDTVVETPAGTTFASIIEEIETLSLTGEMPLITPEIEAGVIEVEESMPMLEKTINIEPISIENTDVLAEPLFENNVDFTLPADETMEIAPIIEELAANPEPTNVFENAEETISEEPIFNIETVGELTNVPSFDSPVETLLDDVELPVMENTIEELVIEDANEEEEAELIPVEIEALPIDEEESSADELTIPTTDILVDVASGTIEDAIQIVKDCAAKLNSIGFLTETEEFDFEEIYQVILKIKKN